MLKANRVRRTPHPVAASPKTPAKARADQLLVDRGLVESRAKAQALILAGLVYSGETRIEKAGQPVKADAPLDVRGQDHPWVSRGGCKLAGGLEAFPTITPKGAICLDVGASTGGFTDVLLTHGAAKVYAVDVGKHQLHWRLQNDPRIVRMDETNARHLTRDLIPDPIDLVVCDASFISLAKVLAAPLALCAPKAALIALIKPQFEVEPHQVGKGGIVKDEALHAEVCERVRAWVSSLPGWQVLGIADSPIFGQKGNKEFLIGAARDATTAD